MIIRKLDGTIRYAGPKNHSRNIRSPAAFLTAQFAAALSLGGL